MTKENLLKRKAFLEAQQASQGKDFPAERAEEMDDIDVAIANIEAAEKEAEKKVKRTKGE